MRRPIAEAVSLTDAVPRELKSTTISVDDLVLDRDHAYVIVSSSVRLGKGTEAGLANHRRRSGRPAIGAVAELTWRGERCASEFPPGSSAWLQLRRSAMWCDAWISLPSVRVASPLRTPCPSQRHKRFHVSIR